MDTQLIQKIQDTIGRVQVLNVVLLVAQGALSKAQEDAAASEKAASNVFKEKHNAAVTKLEAAEAKAKAIYDKERADLQVLRDAVSARNGELVAAAEKELAKVQGEMDAMTLELKEQYGFSLPAQSGGSTRL